MEFNHLNIPDYQLEILELVISGFRQRNLDVEIIEDNQSLYLQSGEFMRGNLSVVLEDLTSEDPSEWDAYISQLVTQAELLIKGEAGDSGENSQRPLDSPYMAMLAKENTAPQYSWGSLGGGIDKYVLQRTAQGYEYCLPRKEQKTGHGGETIWQNAICGTDQIAVADMTTLEDGIISLQGTTDNFASRILNLPKLLKEVSIDYSDLGVFFAIPCQTAILVLPICPGRAQQQALALVQYVGDLIGNPEFDAELGVLGEFSYYWNPLTGGSGSSICYEQECIVDGEPYIELKIPSHLDIEEGL